MDSPGRHSGAATRLSIVGVCAGIALTLALATPAHAAINSFEGACDVRGTATFDKPLTGTAQDNVYHFPGSGSCSGTLNGMSVSTPIETGTDGPFYGSCYSARSTAAGPGFLKFTFGTAELADDVVIRYTMTWTADTVNGTNFQFEGDSSGWGAGHSDVPPEDLPGFFSQCQGNGVSQVRFTAQSRTYSPLVSADSSTPGGGPNTVSPRLLLGPTRGMRRAGPGRPFRIQVRALGGPLRDVRILVRDSLGRTVGRSRRFSLGAQRKRVQVSVTSRLAAGRYRIVAAGRDAANQRVRADRWVRLRRSH